MKYDEVARRFKEAMREKRITASELSNKCGVGKSAISHYMNGRYCPHNVNATLIADVLEVSPIWLMGFDVPKYSNNNKNDSKQLMINTEASENESIENYIVSVPLSQIKKTEKQQNKERIKEITVMLEGLDENKLEIALAYLQGLVNR